MNLIMAGLDWHRAPIELREALSFTRSQVVELDRRLWKDPRVEGCALLSTCNRTELYLSCTDGAEVDAGELLCAAAGVEHAPFAQAFTACEGREAARRLMEVAGGAPLPDLGGGSDRHPGEGGHPDRPGGGDGGQRAGDPVPQRRRRRQGD